MQGTLARRAQFVGSAFAASQPVEDRMGQERPRGRHEHAGTLRIHRNARHAQHHRDSVGRPVLAIVLALDPLVDLFSVDSNVFGRVEANANLIARHFQDDDCDLVWSFANDKLFASSAGKDQHSETACAYLR
jgi:hypothetical protein